MAYKDSISYQIGRPSTAEALERAIYLCKQAQIANSFPSISFTTNIRQQELSLDTAESFLEDFNELAFEEFESLQIKWPSQSRHHIGNINISITTPPNQINAIITVQNLEQSPKKLIDIIFDIFGKSAAVEPRFANLPAELANFHRQQERVFANREAHLLAAHKRLTEVTLAAEERANSSIEEMRAKLNTHRQELDEAYQAKHKNLEEEKERFDKMIVDFDDRQRTHARRKHEELLKEVVDKYKSFAISKQTLDKRKSTRNACLFAFVVSAVLYGAAIAWIYQAKAVLHIHWSMLATATLIFGSTIAFYIRWTDAWSSRHAEIETQAQSLEADFIRASWLAEMLFEWHKESDGNPFPDDALKTFTAGLFERSASASIEHPVHQLISNLRNIKSFEAGKNTIKVEAAGGSQKGE